MKRLAKTVLSIFRYRSLNIPPGSHILRTILDLSKVELGTDVTLKDSVIGEAVEAGNGSSVFSCHVSHHAVLGASVVVTNCQIGPYSALHDGAEASGCSIGQGSYLAARTKALRATIGNFTSIGPECLIGLPEHPVDWLTTSPHFYGAGKRDSPFNHADLTFEEHGDVWIGSDVWLGARVIVRSGVRIGHGAIVAAGAVVSKDVESYTIVGGVPAKLIRRRRSEVDAERLLRLAWWDWPNELLLKIGPLLAARDIDALEQMAKARLE